MLGTMADISERARIEKTLTLAESRLEALLQLGKLAEGPGQAITDFALEEAVRLTGSRIGYVGFLNEDQTALTIHSRSRSVMAECAMTEKNLAFPMAAIGLQGEPVRQRRPVITNDDAAANPRKNGYPAGHIRIERHLGTPAFDGDRVVAVAGVANKEQPYEPPEVVGLARRLPLGGGCGLQVSGRRWAGLSVARSARPGRPAVRGSRR